MTGYAFGVPRLSLSLSLSAALMNKGSWGVAVLKSSTYEKYAEGVRAPHALSCGKIEAT